MIDGTQVKVVAWYDNEWGYANRLVELAERVGAAVPAAVSASRGPAGGGPAPIHEETAMRIEQRNWSEYLAELSRQAEGYRTTIEILDEDIGDQVEARDVPLRELDLRPPRGHCDRGRRGGVRSSPSSCGTPSPHRWTSRSPTSRASHPRCRSRRPAAAGR